VRLAQAGRIGAALANGVGMLVVCVAAAGLGIVVGAGL
jgi:CrcB protein